jgi:hypothetical protein
VQGNCGAQRGGEVKPGPCTAAGGERAGGVRGRGLGEKLADGWVKVRAEPGVAGQVLVCGVYLAGVLAGQGRVDPQR